MGGMAGHIDSSESPRRRYSILLRGSFNPAIFQPEWLVRHGVIDPTSAEQQASEGDDVDDGVVVSSVVAMIKTVSLTVQVTYDRALLRTRTSEISPEELAKRATAALEVLPHTPIQNVEIVAEHHTDPDTLAWGTVASLLIRRKQQQCACRKATVQLPALSTTPPMPSGLG